MPRLNQNSVLLVHPLGYATESAGNDISRLANIMPPLGLASMVAYLIENGVEASIVDCFAQPDSRRAIGDQLVSSRPAFIGFSTTTSSFLDGADIAAMAKRILPDIQTIFGGSHVSALKEKILKDYPAIDYVVVGEGEETLLELIRSGGECSVDIPGLISREKDGNILFTGYRENGVELDSLPFPAYEKLNGFPHTYKLPIFNYPSTPNASCTSSRGCPYSCSYCDRSVFQRSYRFNSAEYMYEHMRYLKGRFGVSHVNFYDDQFTFNRKRIEDFCNMVRVKRLDMTFNCAVRAEHVDRDLLKQLREAGCWMVSLGVETGDPDLLARHRQNVDLDLLSDTIHMIKETGLRSKALLMMGLPGETMDSIQRSMDYVFSLPVDDFNLSKFTPFPGSPIYEHIHEFGDFDEDWEKMDCMNFQFVPRGLTKERLEKQFENFYKKHFMRPRVLMGYVRMLWRSPDSWRRFVLNLGSFLRFAFVGRRLG